MIPRSIAIAASSLCIGFGAGYIVAQRRLTAEFEDRLEKETAGMREFYQAVKKPYATPQEAAAALINGEEPPQESTAEQANGKVAYHKIVKKEYLPEEDPEQSPVTIDGEVFSETSGGVVAEELRHQNVFKENPHIITQDEFMQNDSEYIQGQLTYYRVDKVLTDEREDVIEDQDATVGNANLLMFGDPKSGSSDPNIIHIRNGRLQMEFEVCLSENSYRREVLGIDEDPPQRPSGRNN
jgi:hypothetical protein